MGKVSVSKIEYKGWANCVQISNGIVDMIVTTDVGPRIIRYGFVEKQNMFYEDASTLGKTGGDEWNTYGGHRLWHSPEDKLRSYENDNFPIESWSTIENGISVVQGIEPNTRMKKEFNITLSDDSPEVMIIHRITNKSMWEVELAAWSISVMAPGGVEIIPDVVKETGLLPNRMISLWDYTKMGDSRVTWGDKYIMLRQDSNATSPFKIGLPNEEGWGAYINGGNMFVKSYIHFDDAPYPDYASSYETYTNSSMIEIETLSPLCLLAPGEFVEHIEEWSLFANVAVPSNEAEIDEKILPLIKSMLE